MYRNYDEIEKEYLDTKIPYEILLTSSEWKNFRDIIVREQGFTCQICQEKPNYLAWELKSQYPNSDIYARFDEDGGTEYSCTHIVLHLHHKYYINNRLPWQYKKEVLQTLCAECHTKAHKKVIMKYQTDALENPEPTINCEKCFGTGYIHKYHYHHAGICFMCDGRGYSEI